MLARHQPLDIRRGGGGGGNLSLKQNLVVYIMPGFKDFGVLMKKLGKYKTGKSCLYINKLEDIDESILENLIDRSVKLMRKRYETK